MANLIKQIIGDEKSMILSEIASDEKLDSIVKRCPEFLIFLTAFVDLIRIGALDILNQQKLVRRFAIDSKIYKLDSNDHKLYTFFSETLGIMMLMANLNSKLISHLVSNDHPSHKYTGAQLYFMLFC